MSIAVDNLFIYNFVYLVPAKFELAQIIGSVGGGASGEGGVAFFAAVGAYDLIIRLVVCTL